MDKFISHKGTVYFRTFKDAYKLATQLNGRVVQFDRGFAIQYYRSGPYFPETLPDGSIGVTPG